MDLRKLGLVATPMVAFAILVLALRSGARSDVRAAIVYGAPPPKAHLGLAWQLFTVDDDRGVKQPVAVAHLSVMAKAKGREVTWEGASNGDGIAEMWLDLPGIERGNAVDLVVRDRDGDDVLVRGAARWHSGAASTAMQAVTPWAHFGRREGDVVIDVAVYGQRLAPSFPTSLWVRATSRAGAPLANVTLTTETDGLQMAPTTAKTDERGWAQLIATAQMHYASLGIKAQSEAGALGEWAGTLATAPGASHGALPARLAPDTPYSFELVGASEHLAYVEIQDAQGRVWADTIAFVADANGAPRATVRMPRLHDGLHWLVTSGTPSGAEKMSAGTLVDPFFVASTDEGALRLGSSQEVCASPRDADAMPRAIGPCVTLSSTPGPFARWIALEGFASKHAHDADRRLRGIVIALGALVVAATLEGLIIVTGVRDSRRRLRASGEGSSDEMKKAAPRVGVLRIAIALLVALLGFALIAILVLRSA